jgi:hypothetical protein
MTALKYNQSLNKLLKYFLVKFTPKGLFVSTRLDSAGIDKCNRKIMITTIRDPDLFRVENQFTHDVDTKRLRINPLVKRCGINPALWFLVTLIMMSELVLDPK